MPARLASVPDRPRRVLGVIRVSKEREGGISPDIQLAAIRDYCTVRGYQLADVAEGIDESGSQKRSAWWPTLDRAVASVEDGAYDGIVCWKFSRVARDRLRWAVALDRVDACGGFVESATEQFDTSTSAGRFGRGVMGEMNAFYAEMVGESWKEAHATRIASGRPHSGKARFGYTYDRDEQLHKPHPEQGPLVADLYRRYVAGESIGTLVQWLNRHGWRTTARSPWSDDRLRKFLDNGFAAGLFLAGGDPRRGVAPTLHQGAHEPLITDETWQAYLDARTARRKVPPRREGSAYLLSGLVRCARCGFAMVAFREGPRMKKDHRSGRVYESRSERLSWRCKRCPELGTGPAGYIANGRVEAVVRDHLTALAETIHTEAAGQVANDARRTLLGVEADRLSREGVRLQEALVRLAVSNAESPLPPGIYEQSKTQLEQRAAEVAAALEATGAQTRRASEQPAAEAAHLLDQWDELPVAGLRELLRRLVDCVLVRSGRTPYLRLVEWSEARG